MPLTMPGNEGCRTGRALLLGRRQHLVQQRRELALNVVLYVVVQIIMYVVTQTIMHVVTQRVFKRCGGKGCLLPVHGVVRLAEGQVVVGDGVHGEGVGGLHGRRPQLLLR